MAQLALFVFAWVIYWLTVVGGSIYILPPLGADQLHLWGVTVAYFLLFAWMSRRLTLVRVRDLAPREDQVMSGRQNLEIGVSIVIFTGLCLTTDRFSPISEIGAHRILESEFYFPLFTFGTTVAKVSDVVFQQSTIFLLIAEFRRLGLSKRRIALGFGGLFFSLHLPLLFSSKSFVMFLVVPTFFAGLAFAFLILNSRRGAVWSYALHFLFYWSLGLYFRIAI